MLSHYNVFVMFIGSFSYEVVAKQAFKCYIV